LSIHRLILTAVLARITAISTEAILITAVILPEESTQVAMEDSPKMAMAIILLLRPKMAVAIILLLRLNSRSLRPQTAAAIILLLRLNSRSIHPRTAVEHTCPNFRFSPPLRIRAVVTTEESPQTLRSLRPRLRATQAVTRHRNLRPLRVQ
jgi:hypothetical protein